MGDDPCVHRRGGFVTGPPLYTPPPRLFPLEPLLTRVRPRGTRPGSGVEVLARVAAIDVRNVYRVRGDQDGLLTVKQADEWAVRCGFHPWEIWGDDWFDAAAYKEGDGQ